jgi:TonB family protein
MIRTLFSMFVIVITSAAVAQSPGSGAQEQHGALRLEHADVPMYPQMARVAHIYGTVEVQVTVKDGQVIDTEVKSPQPGGAAILARAAVENIQTWRFYKLDSGTFTTKFVYQLATRKKPLASDSKVELELPLLVRITTAPVVLDTQKEHSASTPQKTMKRGS